MTLAQIHNYPLQLAATSFQLLQQAVIHGLGGEGQGALIKLWTTSDLSTEPLQITEYDPISLSELDSNAPQPQNNTDSLIYDIQDHLQADRNCKLVVLDDDPTGTQTCHDINVLTMWDVDLLSSEFRSDKSGFFILTNSRALPPKKAQALVSEILRNVSQAADITGQKFEVVLRGDSTLRGHLLEELESYIDTIGSPDAWILALFFGPGGRYTINDVQYVVDRDILVPAAKTPYAKDKTFGYKSSNLREWVREKAGSRFSNKDIVSVTLEDIRQGGAPAIERKLLTVPKGGIVIVNAIQADDMLMFSLALLEGTHSNSSMIASNLFHADLNLHYSAQETSAALCVSNRGELRVQSPRYSRKASYLTEPNPNLQPSEKHGRTHRGRLICPEVHQADPVVD